MQINIGFGINNGFSQHCACTMASILANADKQDNYNFYIVYNELSEENKSKINELKKIKPFNIEFIQIEPSDYQKFIKYSSVNPSSFFRIKLFSLKDIDKILYLDSDTIIRTDVKEVYNTNLNNYYLGGAKDILCESLKFQYNLSKNSIYINAGVLLINVKEIRNIDMLEKVAEFHKHFKDFEYSDQDIINFSFQEKIAEFDIRYNYCFPYHNEYNQEYYFSISSNPSIIHYITDNKPWKPGSTCYMKSEYFKYLKLTPYYDDFIETFKIDENVITFSMLNELNNKFDRLFIKKMEQ